MKTDGFIYQKSLNFFLISTPTKLNFLSNNAFNSVRFLITDALSSLFFKINSIFIEF